MRGTLADIACHIMNAVLMVSWTLTRAFDALSLEVVMSNQMMVDVLRVVIMGVLALTAILGRNEMSVSGNKAANSCLYMALVYHAMTYMASAENHAIWGQISVCGVVEMGLVMLVYILCSGDGLWTVLLNLISGVGIVFSGHAMISAGWSIWLVVLALIAETIILWLLVEGIDRWIIDNMLHDKWCKEERTGGYVIAGVCLTVAVVLVLGVVVPISQSVTVKYSDTAYYNDGEKSATLYHVSFGSTEEWKLPEYIMQFIDDEICREYLVVKNEKPIWDFGIGKVYSVVNHQMAGHSVLHHAGDMKEVGVRWLDEYTVMVDEIAYQLQ